ncbi:MAG: ATP-binding cassette domain-containing protein [Desulfotalea sp.]
MIQASDIALSYGKRVIFKDVNIKFTAGNCYGLIGANGAGKTTFLSILSGDKDADKGEVFVGSRERIAVLRQDQFSFDEMTVAGTVLAGHKRLHEIIAEREELYAKTEFTEEDGNRSGELEAEFAEMNGYEVESEAATLLSGLGISENLRDKKMKDLEGGQKVRVLLAQALFGNPDILLLDEPTNNLDNKSIKWLEGFLERFSNTVIIVSHDRHFLNQVCTHMADIDYGRIQVYAGNYEFWYQASELAQQQRQDANKKAESKAKDLKDFIARFSSNASKAKQATARKKMLDKLELGDLPTSTRKYPFIHFKPERSCGDVILEMEDICKTINGVKMLDNFSLTISKGEKIGFVGLNGPAITTLFKILIGEIEPDSGKFRWGLTMTQSYFPKENREFFSDDKTLVDWLGEYTPVTEGESFARGYLGKMLFSGDEATKKTSVLSGGEKVRCMLSRMMLSDANALIFDEPTNHLDLESITALNNGMQEFSEIILFSSHDHTLLDTVANRIIEILPNGIIDKMIPYSEYLQDADVQKMQAEYAG